MANSAHPNEPHDWLWLGRDVRHQPDGTFTEVSVRVCVIPACMHDSAPPKYADVYCLDAVARSA
jgi:hypothetical protein